MSTLPSVPPPPEIREPAQPPADGDVAARDRQRPERGRALYRFAPGLPVTPLRAAWPWLVVAVAGLSLVAAGGRMAWREVHPTPGVVQAAGTHMIDARGGAESVLPRDDFVLGWSPVSNRVSYTLTVTDEDLNVLFRRTGILEARCVVPESAFEGLPAGTRVLWHVTADTTDGKMRWSKKFSARIGI